MTEVDVGKYYKEALGEIVGKKIKIVILLSGNLEVTPIKKYILDNYNFLKTVQEFDIYLRKS